MAYREEFKEGVLENLPLFVLIGNHWDVHFAEILREQEDETDGAETNRTIIIIFRVGTRNKPQTRMLSPLLTSVLCLLYDL